MINKRKKVLGYLFILFGIGCIAAGIIFLKSPSSESTSSQISEGSSDLMVSSSTSSESPQSESKVSVQTTELQGGKNDGNGNNQNVNDQNDPDQNDENHRKGVEFEKYIVNRFGTKYWKIQEWRGDKGVNGRYSESNMNPDLEMKLALKDTEYVVAIECKWRSSAPNGEVKWSYPEQLKRYQNYASQKKIPVFLALGIGGEPSNPKALYLIPLKSISSSTLSLSDISTYKVTSNRSFFYDTTLQDFKRN